MGQARGFGHADLLLYKRLISSLSAVRRRHRRLRQPSELCLRVTSRQKYTPIASDRARRSQIRYCCKAIVGHRLVKFIIFLQNRKICVVIRWRVGRTPRLSSSLCCNLCLLGSFLPSSRRIARAHLIHSADLTSVTVFAKF